MRPPIGLEEFVRYASSRKQGSPPSAYALQLWHALTALQKHSADFRSIVDVGPHRDGTSELLHHCFLQDFTYQAVAPDPSHADAPEVSAKDADCALFLDVIDLLSNPIPYLDAINRALRPGGTLVLMTNNLTALPRAYRMLVWGQSPNAHPAQPRLSLQGKLRAPLREFSAGELAFFLRLSGFEIAEHRYFQREGGDYRQAHDGTIVKASWVDVIKAWPHHFIMRIAPHFADRQLVVATKTEPYEDVVKQRPQPTSSMSEWLRMCAEHSV
jgi:SAM-dependent methyltransferase